MRDTQDIATKCGESETVAATRAPNTRQIQQGSTATAPDILLRLAITEALDLGQFPTVGELQGLRADFLKRFRQAA